MHHYGVAKVLQHPQRVTRAVVIASTKEGNYKDARALAIQSIIFLKLHHACCFSNSDGAVHDQRAHVTILHHVIEQLFKNVVMAHKHIGCSNLLMQRVHSAVDFKICAADWVCDCACDALFDGREIPDCMERER